MHDMSEEGYTWLAEIDAPLPGGYDSRLACTSLIAQGQRKWPFVPSGRFLTSLMRGTVNRPHQRWAQEGLILRAPDSESGALR
jgi:hypothetical protein